MWHLGLTTSFERAFKHYEKKRESELAAVMRNLERYMDLLNTSKNHLSVQAGFIHTEPMGILALDQKAGGRGLQETRLYIFPEEKTKTVHLITIGNKKEQSQDLKLARQFVESLSLHTSQS